MTVVNQYTSVRVSRKQSNLVPLHLIHRALSSRKLLRKFPFLAAFHKLADGALIGSLLAVITMSALSLHAQYLWTLSFSRLETSRELINELKESIAILESDLLSANKLPQFMVPTRTSDLLYLPRPSTDSKLSKDSDKRIGALKAYIYGPVVNGY